MELDSLAAVMDSASLLRERRLPGVLDVVAAARTVLVRCDSPASAQQARAVLSRPGPVRGAPVRGARHSLDTVYDGADLAHAAQLAGLGADALVRWHAGQEWVAAFAGFAPGFMYLAPSERALNIPRQAVPRTVVPAGSVAVGGEFSAIYPSSTPGGWQLLGRCADPLWDPGRAQPALIQPGDKVRFKAVRELVHLGAASKESGAGSTAAAPGSSGTQNRSGLEILAPGVFSTVQDLGRPGHAHLGVTGSGALDRPALRRANRMVGNAPARGRGPGAAGLELVLGGLRVRARGTQLLAVAGTSLRLIIDRGTTEPYGAPLNAPFLLPDGAVLSVEALPPHPGLRSIVAVRGGVAVPPVLGSRATDVLSGLGPPVVGAGTFLPTGGTTAVGPVGFPEPAPAAAASLAEATLLRFTSGPRGDWFTAGSLSAFGQQNWHVGVQSNRIGLRLQLPGPAGRSPAGGSGQPLARTAAHRGLELPSEGILEGSIQVPPSGLPVVFLADHPVTGGYPVLGVVVAEDLAKAAALAPGAAVRFAALG